MTTCPDAHEGLPERQAFTIDALLTSGLVMLINRELLHPRGLALAIESNVGWSLHSSPGGEPITFDLPAEFVAERDRALADLFALAYETGCAPEGAIPAFWRDGRADS